VNLIWLPISLRMNCPEQTKTLCLETGLERFNRNQTLKREITTTDLVHFTVKQIQFM
jgi:hypothetical protein